MHELRASAKKRFGLSDEGALNFAERLLGHAAERFGGKYLKEMTAHIEHAFKAREEAAHVIDRVIGAEALSPEGAAGQLETLFGDMKRDIDAITGPEEFAKAQSNKTLEDIAAAADKESVAETATGGKSARRSSATAPKSKLVSALKERFQSLEQSQRQAIQKARGFGGRDLFLAVAGEDAAAVEQALTALKAKAEAHGMTPGEIATLEGAVRDMATRRGAAKGKRASKPKADAAAPKNAPAPGDVAGQGRKPLSTAERNRRSAELKARQKDYAESQRLENELKLSKDARQKELQDLAQDRPPRPAELEKNISELMKLDPEERIDAVDALLKKPDISPASEKYLSWLKKALSKRGEIENIENDIQGLVSAAKTALERAEQSFREASRAVKAFMRKTGPHYREKTNKVHLDEILGHERWSAQKKPTPRLATDHLVPLRKISEMSELTELLQIYEKAPQHIKNSILEDLVSIGDIEENLVRMRKDANEFKSDKSWHEILPQEVRKYDYTPADVAHWRTEYDRVETSIRAQIRTKARKYEKYK